MNTQPLYIKNATLVLVDNVLNNASLLIENGKISAINPKIVIDNFQPIDAKGNTVMPCMIYLHVAH